MTTMTPRDRVSGLVVWYPPDVPSNNGSTRPAVGLAGQRLV